MDFVTTVFLTIFLTAVAVLALFNILYVGGVERTRKQTGMHPPTYIHGILRVNIVVALFVVGLIAVFMAVL
ncbi:hypothetical protein HYT33_01760 [Candidatus Roizmanbacteria bacterium]|nr:hypothetical protein [Candidatus Roizmanbacteria bacterium]